ncbi:hypothetical protein Acsp04_51740 [Actinomadura sp. NBRC 104425]|nr:hypothetical protein Acsp04_51740 [Actinomadura sp. NBRC 104425]
MLVRPRSADHTVHSNHTENTHGGKPPERRGGERQIPPRALVPPSHRSAIVTKDTRLRGHRNAQPRLPAPVRGDRRIDPSAALHPVTGGRRRQVGTGELDHAADAAGRRTSVPVVVASPPTAVQ